MRKNHFAKLARYIKNVYHLERGLNKLLTEELTQLIAQVKLFYQYLLGFC